MVEDNTKIQNGTLNCTGTNDTSLEFDARSVGEVFTGFNKTMKSITRYLKFKGVKASVSSLKSEINSEVALIVTLQNREDLKSVEKEILGQMRMNRLKMTSRRVTVHLVFKDMHNLETLEDYIVPWD